MMQTVVKTKDLKEVVDDFYKIKKDIDDLYLNIYLKTVKNNFQCYDKLGISQNDEILEISQLIDDFDDRFDKIIYVLDKKVILEYDELSSSIVHSFNNDFVNQFNDLMK